VSERRVLRRIFGPKREEEVVGWRRLQNEELHNLCFITYYYDYQVKENDMDRRCSTQGWAEECIQNFGQKTLLRISKHRWEDNIRMDLRNTECECLYWIHVAQYRDQWQALVNTAPLGSIKGREFLY
jgi:hypothetical protein